MTFVTLNFWQKLNSHAGGVRYCLSWRSCDLLHKNIFGLCWFMKFFFMNFDFKNGFKNEFKDKNKNHAADPEIGFLTKSIL